jgi:hypothetical protein
VHRGLCTGLLCTLPPMVPNRGRGSIRVPVPGKSGMGVIPPILASRGWGWGASPNSANRGRARPRFLSGIPRPARRGGAATATTCGAASGCGPTGLGPSTSLVVCSHGPCRALGDTGRQARAALSTQARASGEWLHVHEKLTAFNPGCGRGQTGMHGWARYSTMAWCAL